MASATKKIVFPDKGRLPSLFSTETGSYPSQTRNGPGDDYGGEYRGFYRTKQEDGSTTDRWFPKQSHHDGRGSKANNHNGIDIYTAYFPFPLETPIRAVTDGYFTPIYDQDQPNKIGNRAAIETKVANKAVTFRYGHLARFEGRARRIKKGDVIGYAGCSGNADTQGECQVPGNCNITSCHVHLVAAFGTTNGKLNDVDPAALLNWSLDFKASEEPMGCSAWVASNGLQEPPSRAGENGGLFSWTEANWRRKKGRRRSLDAPFDTIEFDSTSAIRTTQRAYSTARARLDNPQVLAKAIDCYLEAGTAIEAIATLIEEEIARMRPGQDVGGPVARAQVMARHALWYAIGGKALAYAIDNRRRSEISGLAKTTSFFECGIGVGGEAQLIAADGGRVALQRATLTVDGASLPVVSLSFGAGSLMHATWPDRVAAEAYWELGFHVESAAWLIWWAGTDIQRKAKRLSDISNVGRTLQTEALDGVKERLGTINLWLRATARLLDPAAPQNPFEPPLRDRLAVLLKKLAATNEQVFRVADAESIKKETTQAIGPRFSMLLVGAAPAS